VLDSAQNILVFESITEYVTFRRLIKMCYGTTFIKEGDRDLDVSELVRLIHVANAFECMDAVKQCTVALQGGDLDWEGATQCIELGELLKGVEGMRDLAKKAGRVIAKEVGPVDELFVPAEAEDGGDVLGGLRLSAKVKVRADNRNGRDLYQFTGTRISPPSCCSLTGCKLISRPLSQALPPTVFEALLSSKGIQLKTANEAFWLLLSWVEAQSEESEEGKQALFTRMAKHLQFHSMDPGYILLMVSDHPRIISAGLQLKAVKDSLRHSNQARRTHDEIEEFHAAGPSMPSLTRPGERVSWAFNGRFKAADITAIKTGEECSKVVGLGAGLPWYIELCLQKGAEAEAIQAAVYTNVRLPFDWMTYEDGGGFYFRVDLIVGFGTPCVTNVLDSVWRNWCEERACGDRFAAWDDVFREGSEWLKDGELCVGVIISIINDQGPSVSKEVQNEDEDDSEEEE
jgi:hypothetical protein